MNASGRMKRFILLAALTTVDAWALDPKTREAKTLNARGMVAYRAKDYPRALTFFEQALKADDTHALAHYNFAATLGVLRKKRRTCEFDAYRSRVLHHLARSVELDPTRRDRMQKDADFDTVRDSLVYQQLLGRSLEKAEDLPRILESVSWFGPGVGAFGTLVGVDFQPKGQATLWYREISDSVPVQVKERKIRGTWKLSERKITLELAQPYQGARVFEGALTDKGALDMAAPLGLLLDQPSECDA